MIVESGTVRDQHEWGVFVKQRIVCFITFKYVITISEFDKISFCISFSVTFDS